ncbi:reverse transcriptase domain-containing protein [Bacillus thuringiensis]|uniref:reverse transcriptase domain-containing protein n=1 Tax=Bacillus thuringiensis TaxID=1428 RepID=UPI001FAD53F3|nr:reverse transcriptase domain-containing protein [Bacillus thuringiensis]MDM8365043.1 reverse transcriptase domain-containing protein [Bacillus thuringiensis]
MQNEWYKEKYIKRKNKVRKIITYNDESVREKHSQINRILNEKLMFSKFSKAYIKGTSIFYNAKSHMYNDIFICIDIKKIFNNIDHKILLQTLYYELNKTEENVIKYGRVELKKLIEVCSISSKGLPLGLITSPALANIYLKEFDNILYGKLKKLQLNNVIYTRYADDLTISFKYIEDYLSIKDVIINEVSKLLKRYRLEMNDKKERIINLNKSNHVRITGVSIVKNVDNYRQISVGRKVKKELFYKAINAYLTFQENPSRMDFLEMKRIKGMESFILSIEKNGYESCYSVGMMRQLEELNFNNLHDLINSLPIK